MMLYGLEIIGHRGAAGLAPENTLAGLRAAAALGVRHVEVDVRLTTDGAAVLMHDPTLDRTTDGTGRVEDTTLARIGRLDAGGWFAPAFGGERVPSLSDALRTAAALGLTVNLEIKAETAEAAERAGRRVAACVIHGDGSGGQAYISSFWPQALRGARDMAPGVPRALLVEAIPDDWVGRLRETGATALHAAAAGLMPSTADAVTQGGFLLRCYTVNDRREARRLAAHGVSAIFTDFPDRMGG